MLPPCAQITVSLTASPPSLPTSGAAQGVAAQQFGVDAELLHLAGHGRGLRSVAAKEDGFVAVWPSGWSGMERKSVDLSVVNSLADHGQAQFLGFLAELFRPPLAEGRAVVDDGDVFTFITLAA